MTTTPKSRVSTESSQVNFGAYQHDLTAQKITSAIKELDSIYGDLAGHVRILAGDVEDGRRAVRSFDLDHRTDLKSNYDIEPLLEELTTERGLGWSDISYLCRVSVSSIRKWRAGDPIPDAQLVKLARLAAFLDMLADVGPVGHTVADDDDIKLIARIALNAGNDDAAPAHSQIHAALSAQNLQHLVQQARQRNRFDATYRRGLAALERILESLIIPEESALLPNYPNPFNPETWIPYQLASPAEVTLTLYDVTGRVVRTLHLGHQHAGMYRSKSRAAYWDGRNAQGEPVASGVYFYTLVAGEFAATGKMLIRK